MQGAMQAIYTEFERLRRMSVGGTVVDARSDRNARLNRYSNVLPYDANRVRLTNTAKDYINASLLESPPGEQPKWRYIATQVGPACSTLNSQGRHELVQCERRNWQNFQGLYCWHLLVGRRLCRCTRPALNAACLAVQFPLQ